MQELLDAHPRLGTIYTPSERHITRTSYYNNTISVSSERTWRRPQYVCGRWAGGFITNFAGFAHTVPCFSTLIPRGIGHTHRILLGDLKGIEVTRARLQEQLDALNNV